MNITFRISLTFLVALFTAQLCAQEVDTVDRSQYKLLWEIAGNGLEGKHYLFGTYHSNDPDIFNFPDELYEAINNAEAVVLEADITELMDQEQYFNRSGYSIDNSPFDWRIPTDNQEEITYTNYGSDEGRPQFIDLYFKQIADNCDKKFYPLESIQDQLNIGLVNEIDTTVEGYIETPTPEEMKQLYLEGKADVLHEYTKLSTRRYLNLYKDLITDRNHVMANGLDTLMHLQKTFCAVGTAHLLGPEGIVPLLREKGYTVERVNATFTDQKTAAEKALNKCSGYYYADPVFGASIEFSGKPVVVDEENGTRLVQYQEMGQGNTYSISMQHYEVITDLDQEVREYFTTSPNEVFRFDSLELKDGTKAYQAKIDRGGDNIYWLRAFHRNEIVYTLYCTGGYRFVNSNRPFQFFDKFDFLNSPKTDPSALDSLVYSPSQTLRVNMPSKTRFYDGETETDKYWYAKWFDPYDGSSYYIYENQVTDNSLYLNDQGYGDYLLQEFHPDSTLFYDFESNDRYSEKRFKATSRGRTVYGKMRLVGNLIHFAQYTGSDSLKAKVFLDQFQFSGFEEDQEIQQQPLSNASLKSYFTKTGFAPQQYEEDYRYRNTRHYLMNDPELAITFQAYRKTFHDWAFSDKTWRDLLSDQVVWPTEEVNVEIDSTYEIVNDIPQLKYTIHYIDSKNLLQGKVVLTGKTIGACNMIHPYAAKRAYQSLHFVDSIEFFASTEEGIDSFSQKDISQELISEGPKRIAQLIEHGHVGPDHLKKILFIDDSIYQQFDANGFLQHVILVHLGDDEASPIDIVELWKRRSRIDNPMFTEGALYYCAMKRNEQAFNTIASLADEKGIPWRNKEELVKMLQEDPSFIATIWSSFERSIKDSLSWEMSYLLSDLTQNKFFKQTFQQDGFATSMLAKHQPEWAAFRYFEWIYKSDISNKNHFLDSLISKWQVQQGEDFRIGVKLAWKHILHGKLGRRDRKKIEANITRSIAYAKVMAISGTPEYKVFSFEEIIGLLSFDHYEDSFYDPNKTIEMIDEFALEGERFAIYRCIENKKVFYLAQQLPETKTLPSYKDFGVGAYFFFFEKEPEMDEIKKSLSERLSE